MNQELIIFAHEMEIMAAKVKIERAKIKRAAVEAELRTIINAVGIVVDMGFNTMVGVVLGGKMSSE